MRNKGYYCFMFALPDVGRRIESLLEELIQLPVRVELDVRPAWSHFTYRPDMIVSIGPYHFAAAFKASGTSAQVAGAARQLRAGDAGPRGDLLPLLVVPYMSAGGKAIARENRVSWLDLSGNASLEAPGFRVIVEGKPNRFVRRGRPRDLFAPRSVRITRALLLDPLRPQTQAELVNSTGLNRGTVSRVLAGLAEANLIRRLRGSQGESGSAIEVPDPNLLLDAWREAADFRRQSIHRYLVAARSAVHLTHDVARAFAGDLVDPIATGLSAAWLYAPFADFRVATFYVRQLPSEEELRSIGARPEARGANLWLVLPKDEGVRMGQTELEGTPCVSAVQAYVDLKDHPERASEAAEALREARLHWPRPSANTSA